MAILDIIVPVYNEEAAIQPFYTALTEALHNLDATIHVYFVDDGSRDTTFVEIKKLHQRAHGIHAIKFSRNFGKEIAISAGLKYCKGDAAIVMDIDLQDPPELIPRMLNEWKSGVPVVLAQRSSRASDQVLKSVSAHCFYAFINMFSRIQIPKNVGDFRLLDREVIDALNTLPEKTRFMKGLFAWIGFESTTIHYERPARAHGKTKFSYWKLWNLALQAITSFSDIFIRLSTYFGVIITCLSMGYGAYLVGRTIIHGIQVPGYASLMVVILVSNGIILMTLGVMGEYIARIFIEVKNRPLFVVSHTLGLNADRTPPHNG